MFETAQYPYLRGKVRLLRHRWLHRAVAHVLGYFWLSCPSCGQMFSGREWKAPDRFAFIGDRGVCPACTDYNRAHPEEWAARSNGVTVRYE